jgi:ATP-dependent DNA helicase RecG
LLNVESYFDLCKIKYPLSEFAVLQRLEHEKFIRKNSQNTWDITNLGAILFAKNLRFFQDLKRKSIRVIHYSGTNKINAIKEQQGTKGYASGFEGLLSYIDHFLPVNEVIETTFRQQVKMYPPVAIREIVANALIHQDFSITGAGVTIEIFADRMEITNPGTPLVEINRFIDTSPRSRNEQLASLLRRLNICEERGSGIDRVIESIELFQLPAPKFIREEDYTRVILYAYKTLSKMDKEDKIRACYQHCVLQYISSQKTNNESLRKRFNIADSNYPIASRIFSDTVESGLIRPADPTSSSRKHANYVPYWV